MLLALARAAIASSLQNTSLNLDVPEPRCFSLYRGAFVTLHVAGKLRGCIGVIEPRDPLRDTIVHCARSAAFHDPRFSPLRTNELNELQIEISLLSELLPIRAQDLQIGRHGLLVATESHRGLLLPQVATEHHLSREEFLDETCRKAGLPRGAWRDAKTEIFGFTCEVFSEHRQRTSA